VVRAIDVRASRARAVSASTAGRSSLREVLVVALRLGLTSFGGPIAHLGYFRREYVERRGWLSETAYGDLVALCQLLPGPASSQLGIAIGTLRAGRLGGLVAWLGFTLPSAIALTAFALLASNLDIANAGWVHGLKIAAVAVVATAVVAMWRSLAPDLPRSLMAIAAAAISLVLPSPFTQVAIIVAGGLIGRAFLTGALPRVTADEPAPLGRRFAVACLVVFAALLVGLPLARTLVPDHTIALVEAFNRAGSLVFGGGHVVLPLLHATVVEPGWVTDNQFLAGYGVAQAVPGPLFTFSAFLGAIEAPSPNGVAGATIALLAIFVPSFLLIWGTLPFWHRLRGSASVLRALAGTNAAVVGILVAALYTPVWTSAIGRPADALLALMGFVLLTTRRASPLIVVVLCAVGGEVIARLT
jgi:chromate transporter